jgi:hypothetical protein
VNPQETITCLNCGHQASDQYCSKCGQPTDTQRITLPHVFKKEFLKWVLYYNKGLFHTLKQLFSRPGHAIREYVAGKRIDHLGYISFLFIAIILFTLAEKLTGFSYSRFGSSEADQQVLVNFDRIINQYGKWLFLVEIIFYSACSYLFFRKARQNYAEHLVLNAYKTSAILFINIFFILLEYFPGELVVLVKINRVVTWLVLIYGCWFYYQYFSAFYQNKFLLLIRSLLAIAIPSLLFVGSFIYLLMLLSGL